MHVRHLLTLITLTALVGSVGASEYVWWEGETPAESNISDLTDMRTPGNANAEQQAKLSGGRWLTIPKMKNGDAPPTATYTVQVPKDGTYNLYVRKFWKHGPFKWRFDDGEWETLGKDIALLDNTFLQKHWGANWVAMGQVELQAGERRFAIESIDGGGCIDCFLLIDGAFSPRGKLKPGEKTGDAEPGYFAWEPDKDPLNGESPIDLGYLNEDVAGESGFVRRDGDRFVLGNGKEVKFWMVQGGLNDLDRADIDRWAKRLRKNGVNLVRTQFSGMFNLYAKGKMDAFQQSLDKYHYVVAALKREGIYMYFGHLYWHTSNDLPKDIIPGFKGGKGIGLPFFAEEYQEFFRGYAKAIFEPENPYTGLPLAKEPAVAFVEVNNESSLLFWSFNPKKFSEPELALLERKFADWCTKKYGSVKKTLAAWRPANTFTTPDQPGEGRLGLYGAGHLTGADWAAAQRDPQRAADQLQWMIEGMHDYYGRFATMLKDDIGIGSLVSASNWKSADDRISGGLERYSYTATDVVLRNDYFETAYPNKEAMQKFYAIELGDTFASVSGLKAPSLPSPLAAPLIADHPFMVTENNWTRPNRFRAEWPVLIASYGSMMGIDGWCFFALGNAEWQIPMDVWDINNPTILGQFPACALMYRRGDVSQPEQSAVDEKVALADAYAFKGTKINAVGGKDALWVAAIGDKEGSGTVGKDSIDPRAYFVGPVRQTFHDGPSSVETVDLDQYIDASAQTITSMTGELKWNYDQGVLRIDTPTAQGVTGFLGAAGTVELGDVTITSQNEYGSILVVSLDGKPIATSKKLLVQCATEDMPFGFKTQKQGEYGKITNLGGYPLNVKLIKAAVSVKSGATEAVVLDGNGYLTERQAKTTKAGKGLQITLPEDAIYTLLR